LKRGQLFSKAWKGNLMDRMAIQKLHGDERLAILVTDV
jgi:hypothetical protein